jgi:hypothetical protein
MDIEKIIEAIEEKAESGANYKRTRGPPDRQIHDKGKRVRLGDGVVARWYERDGAERHYEVFEHHQRVLYAVKGNGEYVIREPVEGKWRSKLGLAKEDIKFDEAPDIEENEHAYLATIIIDKARILVRRGTHFDKAEENIRAIGRLYEQDGITIRLMRLELPEKSSPTFLDIWKDGNQVLTAGIDNKDRKVEYYGETTWAEEFLKIK